MSTKQVKKFVRERAPGLWRAGTYFYWRARLASSWTESDFFGQLRRLGHFLTRRRTLAARYDAALSLAPFKGRLAPLSLAEAATLSYHIYVVRVLQQGGETAADVAGRRKDLFLHLVASGIHPQVHYIPVPRQPWYREHCDTVPENFPGAESCYAGCLTLALFPSMRDSDVDRVVAAIAIWVGWQ